jgi:Zn-dependent protease
MSDALYILSVWALPVLVAITFHEAAHGWVAWRLGDPTAHRLGRVTFNPIKHIDLFGTILLPALLFLSRAPFVLGYAKPVPVNFRALRRPRRDSVLVALAGPGTNLGLAVASAALIHLAALAPDPTSQWLAQNLANAIVVNLVLAVFNMLPIPPLDGGRVLVGLLPPALGRPLARLERYGLLILIGLLFLLPWLSGRLGHEVNVFVWLIWRPAQALYELITMLTGLK